jgi:hypothetical protein
VANGVAEAAWLRQLLAELHSPLSRSMLVYCDNVSAVYLSTTSQFADIFTKGLLSSTFAEFRSSLNISSG